MDASEWARITEWLPECRRAARRAGFRDSDVDEVASDVGMPTIERCLRLWDGTRPFRAYVMVALRHEYWKHRHRANARALREGASDEGTEDVACPGELDKLDDHEAVQYLLAGLTEYERALLLARYVRGLTCEEVARAMGVCKATVSNDTVAALEKARRRARDM